MAVPSVSAAFRFPFGRFPVLSCWHVGITLVLLCLPLSILANAASRRFRCPFREPCQNNNVDNDDNSDNNDNNDNDNNDDNSDNNDNNYHHDSTTNANN